MRQKAGLSKYEPQSQLCDSRVASRCDLAESRRSERTADVGILRVIEDIEKLCAKLHGHIFTQTCILADREVGVKDTGAADQRPACITEGSRVRQRKHAGIKPLQFRLRRCDWIIDVRTLRS